MGRLKKRDWKTRHRQKYRGGKHGTGKPGTNSQGWKTKEKLYGQPMEQFLQFIEITVSLIL